MFKRLVFLGILTATSLGSTAQLKYIGLTGGLTLSNQKWKYDLTSEKYKGRNYLGWNGSLYTEWGLHDVFTFVSELQYNRKGENSRNILTPDSRIQLGSWNNYAKFRLDWYDGSPYFLLGPRLEYMFSTAPLDFGPIVIGASAGVGYEFYKWDPWVPFVELHFNPSITPSFNETGVKVRERAWELKVGIKFHRKSTRNFDDCPPVFTLLPDH